MAVKIPYIIEPGVIEGYITKAQYVQGSFIVLNTADDILNIPKDNIIDGTPFYIIDSNKILQYDSSTQSLIPSTASIQDAPNDGKYYIRYNNSWYELDNILSNYYTKEYINDNFISSRIKSILGGNANSIF